MIFYVANTNEIVLYGLRGAVDGLPVNTATVTLTIKDLEGEVLMEDIPMVLTTESPPKGDYRAVVDADVSLLPNTSYIAVVDANAGPGRIGHWELKFRPTVRER